jgi:hypothetical protein
MLKTAGLPDINLFPCEMMEFLYLDGASHQLIEVIHGRGFFTFNRYR